MSKSKKITLYFLCVLTVFFFSIGMTLNFFGSGWNTVNAEEDKSVKMVNGASIRLVEPYGLRFTAYVSEEDYNSIKNSENPTKLGMIIVPASYLTDSTKYSGGAEDVKNKNYQNLTLKLDYVFLDNDSENPVDKTFLREGDTNRYMNGVISNLYLYNFDVNFVAIGYVATENESVVSYEFANITENNYRNAVAVSSMAFSDSKIQADQKFVLKEFATGNYLTKKGTLTQTNKDGAVKYVFDGNEYDTLTEALNAANCELSVSMPSKIIVDAGASKTLNANVNDGSKTEITDNITYVSADETIATVNSDGKVVAKKSGTTTITATYFDKSATCTVEVAAVIDKQYNVSYDKSKGTAFSAEEANAIFGSESVTVSKITTDAQGENEVQEPSNGEPIAQELWVRTSDGKIAHFKNLKVYTMIFRTKADFGNNGDYFRMRWEGQQEEYRTYAGSYLIANDIDATGNWARSLLFNGTNSYFNSNSEMLDKSKGFHGYFDGNGKTISNLTISDSGLFGYVGSDAVIKNISFSNTSIESGRSYAAMLAKFIDGATIENVNIDIVTSFENNYTAGLAITVSKETTIDNVVIKLADSTVYCENTTNGINAIRQNYGAIACALDCDENDVFEDLSKAYDIKAKTVKKLTLSNWTNIYVIGNVPLIHKPVVTNGESFAMGNASVTDGYTIDGANQGAYTWVRSSNKDEGGDNSAYGTTYLLQNVYRYATQADYENAITGVAKVIVENSVNEMIKKDTNYNVSVKINGKNLEIKEITCDNATVGGAAFSATSSGKVNLTVKYIFANKEFTASKSLNVVDEIIAENVYYSTLDGKLYKQSASSYEEYTSYGGSAFTTYNGGEITALANTSDSIVESNVVAVTENGKSIGLVGVKSIQKLILTPEDLDCLAANNADVTGYFLVGQDIDGKTANYMTSAATENTNNAFKGVLDGNGKSVSYIANYCGLFNTLQGTVKNIKLVNISYVSDTKDVAKSAIANTIKNTSEFHNVYIQISDFNTESNGKRTFALAYSFDWAESGMNVVFDNVIVDLKATRSDYELGDLKGDNDITSYYGALHGTMGVPKTSAFNHSLAEVGNVKVITGSLMPMMGNFFVNRIFMAYNDIFDSEGNLKTDVLVSDGAGGYKLSESLVEKYSDGAKKCPINYHNDVFRYDTYANMAADTVNFNVSDYTNGTDSVANEMWAAIFNGYTA